MIKPNHVIYCISYSVKALREFRHPYFAGIDINSRFETAPGIKDVERISNFLKELKGGTI